MILPNYRVDERNAETFEIKEMNYTLILILFKSLKINSTTTEGEVYF